MFQLSRKLYLSISYGSAKVSHTNLTTLQNYVKFVDSFACIRKNLNTFSGFTNLSKLLIFHNIFRLYRFVEMLSLNLFGLYCFVWM